MSRSGVAGGAGSGHYRPSWTFFGVSGLTVYVMVCPICESLTELLPLL
ncbi:hypothetical protein P3T27_007417 [Kitasatospora sp. MAA19]|nr:hypothetical protein [Kitasatospora sp. MAA19]